MSTFPATATLPQSGSIVSRWLLDEASGNAIDSVGSNDLTDNNSVGAGTGFSDLGASFDNARDFTLANDHYFSITDGAQSGLDHLGSHTFSGLFFLDAVVNNTIGGKWDGASSDKSYFFFVTNVGKPIIAVSSDGSAQTNLTADTALSTGSFVHLTFVYDAGTRMEIYVNGVSDGTNTTSSPASLHDATSTFFSLGAMKEFVDADANWFDGRMNDVMFWNTALTDSEASDLSDLYTTAPAPTGVAPRSTLSLMGV